MYRWLILGTLLAASVGVHAFDDNLDPAAYPKGGIAPVDNAVYAKECGECHFAYPPGLLPARSWKAVLAQQSHFGEALDLKPDELRVIADYLDTNAADKSDYRGEEPILRNLRDDRTPLRITDLPMMRRNHEPMRSILAAAGGAAHLFTNCTDCHTGAAKGSFANRELRVPNVSAGPIGSPARLH